MALSITNRGTGTHNTGAASFTLSPGSNCTAGATVALCVSADNSSAGGATNDITSVIDSIGNTWTKQQGPVFDNGAASAGVQGAIFTTSQDVGALQTGTVITVDFGSSPVAKTWTLTEITPAAGKRADVRTSGAKAAGATGTAATSGATATANIGEVTLCAIFIEAGTTQTCTGDGDTTNGTWSTLQYAEIGSTTSGSCIASQAKLQTTANSTQTYDVTLGISSDYHSAWVIFREVTPPTNVTPTSGFATALGAAAVVTLGGLSVTPTSGVATATAANPTIALGGLSVTPTSATATALGADPTVELGAGGQNVTPTSGVASALAAATTVTLGALGVTATAGVASALAAAPTVALGGIAATPTPGVGTAAAASPTVQLGGIGVTPVAGFATALGAAPTASSGIVVTPTSGAAVAVAAAPTVTLGGLSVVPLTGVASALGAGPSSSLGPISVAPTPGVAFTFGAGPSSSGQTQVIVAAEISLARSTVAVATAGDVAVGTSNSAVVVITGKSSVEVE